MGTSHRLRGVKPSKNRHDSVGVNVVAENRTQDAETEVHVRDASGTPRSADSAMSAELPYSPHQARFHPVTNETQLILTSCRPKRAVKPKTIRQHE